MVVDSSCAMCEVFRRNAKERWDERVGSVQPGDWTLQFLCVHHPRRSTVK
eukprot:FN602419.1.p3 GENE.FN602419.1~~FN602419.1.p3  ORF type:complete len:50 (+),score=5.04 FN602419.1:104-253(+)